MSRWMPRDCIRRGTLKNGPAPLKASRSYHIHRHDGAVGAWRYRHRTKPLDCANFRPSKGCGPRRQGLCQVSRAHPEPKEVPSHGRVDGRGTTFIIRRSGTQRPPCRDSAVVPARRIWPTIDRSSARSIQLTISSTQGAFLGRLRLRSAAAQLASSCSLKLHDNRAAHGPVAR